MSGRNTTVRDRDRAIIRRSQPPCALCGEVIDFALPHLDPMAYVVDHIIPIAAGGADDIDNKQAAHRSCNAAKAARLPADLITFVTNRCWWRTD